MAVAVTEVFGQLLTGVGDGCGARSEAASPRAEADRGNLIWGMGGGAAPLSLAFCQNSLVPGSPNFPES